VRLFPKVPQAVKDLPLTERRLAWGVTDEGLPVVATPSALHFGDEVLPWVRVEKAVWAPPLLSVREVDVREGAGRAHRFHLDEERDLAGTVRTCVTSSVGWSEVRTLPGGGKVRVVGRRVPGRDAMEWQAVHLEGTDPDDPTVREQVERLVAALRATLG